MPSSCALAESSFNTGLFSKAKDTYIAVLDEKPGEACAVAGLKLTVEKMCAIGQAQIAGNDIEGATATYTAILAKDFPDMDCARTGLADITNISASIKGLIQSGDYDAAWIELQAAIKGTPKILKLIDLHKNGGQRFTVIKHFSPHFLENF